MVPIDQAPLTKAIIREVDIQKKTVLSNRSRAASLTGPSKKSESLAGARALTFRFGIPEDWISTMNLILIR